MNQVIDGYEKLVPITIYKYEFLILMKDGCVFYALEKENGYELLGPLMYENTIDMPLSYIKSRMLMEYLKNVLDNINDKELIYDTIFKIQDVLQYPEIYNLIKNNDISRDKLISTFDEYYNKKNEFIVRKNTKVDNKKHERGNTDIFTIVIITNIGILLFIMLILNIIK